VHGCGPELIKPPKNVDDRSSSGRLGSDSQDHSVVAAMAGAPYAAGRAVRMDETAPSAWERSEGCQQFCMSCTGSVCGVDIRLACRPWTATPDIQGRVRQAFRQSIAHFFIGAVALVIAYVWSVGWLITVAILGAHGGIRDFVTQAPRSRASRGGAERRVQSDVSRVQAALAEGTGNLPGEMFSLCRPH